MQLDMQATLETDTRKGGRVNGKETMARRRYQDGCLFIRGRVGRKVWVARWREDVIRPDGAITRTMRSQVLGSVSEHSHQTRSPPAAQLVVTAYQLWSSKATVNVTFGDFTRKWEEAVLPTYRASTRNFYKDILRRHLAPKFACYRLCDIHTPDVQIFLNQKAERYAPSVLYHIRATLSRTYASAKEWGYVESNPAHGVRLPQKRTIRPKITFEPPQVEKIHGKLKEPHRTLVLVAAVTGMRISELFGLKWSDVDFERRLLRVRRTYYRGSFGLPKNQTSERVIPISPGLVHALQRHKTQGRQSSMDLVFPNDAGNPYEDGNLLHRVLHPVLATLGLPKTDGEHFADPSQQR